MNAPAAVDPVRSARAGLLRAAEAPAPVLAGLVREVGPVEAWDMVRSGRGPGPVRRVVAGRMEGRDAVALDALALDDLRTAAAAGARLVIPEDEEWPEATMAAFALSDRMPAPIGMYVRGGRLPADPRNVVTVIGSRACSAYGRRCGTDLAADLAAAGCRVVSGAAFGVDAAAHRGAMHGGGPASTIAVLACGIDRAYPVAHRELIDDIARGGGSVVSEYPPGTSPARHRFLIRNRLIAAFGAVTVVVEAGRRSGTISTANAAAGLNRVVMAVPGPVTSAMSVGCHDLLRSPGVLIAAESRDVLEVLGRDEPGAPHPPVVRPTDALDGTAALVYEALPGSGSRTVRELARDAAVPAAQVMSALAELELMALATRSGATWERGSVVRDELT